MYIYIFSLTMTDTVASQNIGLSSWDILNMGQNLKQGTDPASFTRMLDIKTD
jgi:hypothetical protein